MKRLRLCVFALLALLPMLVRAEHHLLEIEGPRKYSELKVRHLIHKGDSVELIFRGEGASLTLDKPNDGKNVASLSTLTVSGNGALLAPADNTPTFTVSAFHRDSTCQTLKIDSRLLNNFYPNGLTLNQQQTLVVDCVSDTAYDQPITTEAGTSLSKSGPGTLTLSLPTVYNSLLEVQAGSLVVKPAAQNAYPGGILVLNGATLKNTAACDFTQASGLGNTDIYGTLDMGSSVWKLPPLPTPPSDAASPARAAQIVFYSGSRVTASAACFDASNSAGLSFANSGNNNGTPMKFGPLLKATAGTVTVDVGEGVVLAMPPPSASGTVANIGLKKTGEGRWYCRNGQSTNADGVAFSHKDTTTVEAGSLYIYGVCESVVTVKKSGFIGGNGTMGSDDTLQGWGPFPWNIVGTKMVIFESGGGVDWRGWDAGSVEKLTFHEYKALTLLSVQGNFPYVEQGADFRVVAYDIPPAGEMNLFAGTINFTNDPSRMNFESQKLTFITDKATFRDNYRFESRWTAANRTIWMIPVETAQLLASSVEVFAEDGTVSDTYTAIDAQVKPPVNGGLKLNYLPYKQTPGTFVFDNAEALKLGELSVEGTPGLIDAVDGNITYTRLMAKAGFAVTPAFLNRIDNINPNAFLMPVGRTTVLKHGPDIQETLRRDITGDDHLAMEGSQTIDAVIDTLVRTEVRSGASLAFGANGEFRGPVYLEADKANTDISKATLLNLRAPSRASQSTAGAHFHTSLVLEEGVALDASGVGSPIVAAGRLTLPPSLLLRFPDGFASEKMTLINLAPTAELLGIPPESVKLTVIGGEPAKDYFLQTSPDKKSLEVCRWDDLATAVSRRIPSVVNWYETSVRPWTNDANTKDTYNIPPQDTDVTLICNGGIAGIGMNVSARVKKLTLTADPQFSGIPYLAISSTAKDINGVPCAAYTDNLVIDTISYFWPGSVHFNSAAGSATVTKNGALGGTVRIPNLTLENGSTLRISDGKVAEVTEHLTLPRRKGEKLNVRISSGSFGRTRILTILPTAVIGGYDDKGDFIEGWNDKNFSIEILDVNGNKLPDEEISRCSVIRETDGLYVVKKLPANTCQAERTLTYTPSALTFNWKEKGSWKLTYPSGATEDENGNILKPDSNGNPFRMSDCPPANAYVYLTLDALGMSQPNATATMTFNQPANTGFDTVRGLRIRSAGGSPRLRLKKGSVRLTAEESLLENTGIAGDFRVLPDVGSVCLKRFRLDADTELVVSENCGAAGSVFEPVTDVAFNVGTIVFADNSQLEYTVPQRVGHIHIGSNSTVTLKGNRQPVTQFHVTGAARETSVLRFEPNQAIMTANKFSAKNVTVHTVGNGTVVFDTGVYSGEYALLNAGTATAWESVAENADGSRSAVTLGGLTGSADIYLSGAGTFSVCPIGDYSYAGAFRTTRSDVSLPSGKAAPGAVSAAKVRILPITASANAPDAGIPAGGSFSQTFTGKTDDVLPLEIDGGRLLLGKASEGAYWGGPVRVLRYATSGASGVTIPGEIGGGGTIGDVLTLEPGTILSLTGGGVLTLNSLPNLPDGPLTVRIKGPKLNEIIPALYTDTSRLTLPANLKIQIIDERNTRIGGAYRFLKQSELPDAVRTKYPTDGLYLERRIAKGTLSGGDMTWVSGGTNSVPWTDANGNKLTAPLPDDIDVELNVQEKTNLDIDQSGVAHINDLTVIGSKNDSGLTFLDSTLGADRLDVGTIVIGDADGKTPAQIAVQDNIGWLGTITVNRDSSLMVQENLGNVGVLTDDNPGTLIFRNPHQDRHADNNPPFTYGDEGKIAHIKVCEDTDLNFSRKSVGKYTPDIANFGLLSVNSNAHPEGWPGDITVRSNSTVILDDGTTTKVPPAGLAGAGKLTGSIDFGENTMICTNPFEVKPDKEGNPTDEDLTAVLDFTGAQKLKLPPELLVKLPPVKRGESPFPPKIAVYAAQSAPVNLTVTVPGVPPTVSYTSQWDANVKRLYAISSANGRAHRYRTVDGQNLLWTGTPTYGQVLGTIIGWDGNEWSQYPNKPGSPASRFTNPVDKQVAVLTVDKDSVLSLKNAPTAEALEHIEIIVGKNGFRTLTVKDTGGSLKTPYTILTTGLKVASGASIHFGDMSVAPEARLQLPTDGNAHVSGVAVAQNGILCSGSTLPKLDMSADAIFEMLTADAKTVPTTVPGTKFTAPQRGSLTVRLPAAYKQNSFTANMSVPVLMFSDAPAQVPSVGVRVQYADGTDEPRLTGQWSADGLTLRDVFPLRLPKPNGALDDPSAYTAAAIETLRSISGNVLPNYVRSVSGAGTLKLNAEKTSAALDRFEGISLWRNGMLDIGYEFGISSCTYVTAEKIRLTCSVQKALSGMKPETAQFRSKIPVAVYCKMSPTATEVEVTRTSVDTPSSMLTADITNDRLKEVLGADALKPGTTLIFTVKALPPAAK